MRRIAKSWRELDEIIYDKKRLRKPRIMIGENRGQKNFGTRKRIDRDSVRRISGQAK
jgi:hypothetical protein